MGTWVPISIQRHKDAEDIVNGNKEVRHMRKRQLELTRNEIQFNERIEVKVDKNKN